MHARTVAVLTELLDRIGIGLAPPEMRSPKLPSKREQEQVALLTSWLFSKRPGITIMQPLEVRTSTRLSPINQLTDVLYMTIQWGLFSVPRADEEAMHEHSDLVTASLLALKHIALYKEEDGFDFSAHATPRSGYVMGEYSHFACAALKHYLMHGNHQQRELVCLVIAFSLSMPSNEVANGTAPWARKLEFAKELAKTRTMDRLGTVGIGDLPLSRASVAALGSIAGQLSAHAWAARWD